MQRLTWAFAAVLLMIAMGVMFQTRMLTLQRSGAFRSAAHRAPR